MVVGQKLNVRDDEAENWSTIRWSSFHLFGSNPPIKTCCDRYKLPVLFVMLTIDDYSPTADGHRVATAAIQLDVSTGTQDSFLVCSLLPWH